MSKDIFIMLDLESLANRLNPCLVQISGVPFTLEEGYAPFDNNFNILVEKQSCLDVGLEVNEDTLTWWAAQSDEAKNLVFGEDLDRSPLKEALLNFSEYIKSFRVEDKQRVYLWGNGIRADNVWLLSAYKACGLPDPISYQEDLDLRTLHYLAKKKTGVDYKKITTFSGVPHNAIDDCKYQIECAVKMWEALKE